MAVPRGPLRRPKAATAKKAAPNISDSDQYNGRLDAILLVNQTETTLKGYSNSMVASTSGDDLPSQDPAVQPHPKTLTPKPANEGNLKKKRRVLRGSSSCHNGKGEDGQSSREENEELTPVHRNNCTLQENNYPNNEGEEIHETITGEEEVSINFYEEKSLIFLVSHE